jgi:hypothetical protein
MALVGKTMEYRISGTPFSLTGGATITTTQTSHLLCSHFLGKPPHKTPQNQELINIASLIGERLSFQNV